MSKKGATIKRDGKGRMESGKGKRGKREGERNLTCCSFSFAKIKVLTFLQIKCHD